MIRNILIAILTLMLLSMVTLNAQDATKKKSSKTVKGKSKMSDSVVVMITSMGTIKIELNPSKAPVTVKNFLSYIDDRYYDSTVFHRVISTFMIQGGGFKAGSPIREKETKPPIVNEASNGLSNLRGTIAMARTNDPNSATSQFFINVQDNGNLDKGKADPNGYCVFGKVIAGMDVVDKIKEVPTGNSPGIARYGGKEVPQPFQDVPQTPVVILSVRRADAKGK